MATQTNDDHFDFPDRPVEPIPKITIQVEDLHMGAATVKPLSRSWAEEHGPQPPGAGMRALDYLILAMFAGSIMLMLRACSWAVFS